MRAALAALVLVMGATCAGTVSRAQDGATKLQDEAYAFGFGFLGQPAGRVGVIIDEACDETDLTGRRAYLVQDAQIYWGLKPNCVRVIVNHRSTSEKVDYSYLGVQVVGFFSDPPPTSILLRRSGPFLRDQKALPDWDDKNLSSDELGHDMWDSLNGSGQLSELDTKLSGKWYGIPKDGHSDAWDDRYKFRSKSVSTTMLTLTHKTLDNRLIRFSPYPAKGKPSDGPIGFYLGRRGARAVAVRVFSPVSGDFDHNFVLVFETNPTVVGQLVKRQVVQSGFWNFFSR